MWVKICGVSDRESLEGVCAAQPDAVGLNFYDKSSRYIEPETAAEFVAELPEEITPIGVFVNKTVGEILAITEQCSIRHVQLHGDEKADIAIDLAQRDPELSIIRAFRYTAANMTDLDEFCSECSKSAAPLAACLVDASVPGKYGGTGRSVPWKRFSIDFCQKTKPPLVLSGGLNPENVSRAIEVVQPWGVDVASGIESAPGVKDLQMMLDFVSAARNASLATGTST